MTREYRHILYSNDEGVVRISLNDPATMNAMSVAMGEELHHAVMRASREAKCMILTGEGKAFCSGASLSGESMAIDDPARDVGATLDPYFNPIVVQMKTMAAPVITAFRGPAAGVGCGLAMAGDIIICSETAYFLQAFRHVGLAPDGGSSWLLTKAVGRVRAMELMLLGERFPAHKALEWGLVTRVVPDAELETATMAMARELAAGPRSLGIIKRLAWAAADSSLETAITNERLGQMEAGRTDDFIEGVTAFRERRQAVFTGK